MFTVGISTKLLNNFFFWWPNGWLWGHTTAFSPSQMINQNMSEPYLKKAQYMHAAMWHCLRLEHWSSTAWLWRARGVLWMDNNQNRDLGPHYRGQDYHTFWVISYICQKHPPYIYLPYMVIPMPLSGANCHIYFSHQGRVVIWFVKMCLFDHKYRSLGFNSLCCILLSHKVHICMLLVESKWTPDGLLDTPSQSPSKPVTQCKVLHK